MLTRTSPALLSDEGPAHPQLRQVVGQLVEHVREARASDGEGGAAPDVRRQQPAARADQREAERDAQRAARRRGACCTSRGRPARRRRATTAGSSRSSARSTHSETSGQATRSGDEVRSTWPKRRTAEVVAMPQAVQACAFAAPPSSRAIRAVSRTHAARAQGGGDPQQPRAAVVQGGEAVRQQRRERRLVDVPPRGLEHREVQLVAVVAVAVAEGGQHDHDHHDRGQHTPPGDRRWSHLRRASGAQHLGDEEGQLERLHPVQARVAHRLVAVAEVDLGDLLAAADALGDVVAGELDVDAAGPGAERAVHVEEALHLVDHVLEAAGLVARVDASKVLPCIGSQTQATSTPGGGDLLDQRRAARRGSGRRPSG